MQINLIEEGLKFLILGMTTVYLFLYLMVVVLKIESKIIKKYFPSKKQQEPLKKEISTLSLNKNADEDKNEDEIVAAIMAAIIEHRK